MVGTSAIDRPRACASRAKLCASTMDLMTRITIPPENSGTNAGGAQVQCWDTACRGCMRGSSGELCHRLTGRRYSTAAPLRHACDFFLKMFTEARGPVVGLLIARVPAARHILAISRTSGPEKFAGVGVRANEFRGRAEREADEVVKNQDLPIAIRPCANAEGRNAQAARHDDGELPGNALEGQREGAG